MSETGSKSNENASIEALQTYASDVSVSNVLLDRARSVLDFYVKLFPDQVWRPFITNYVTNDGAVVWENLWFFSTKFVAEAKMFAQADTFDVAVLIRRVDYWVVTKQDFDLSTATDSSRMTLDGSLGDTARIALRASGRNCRYLADLLREVVIPNLVSAGP